MCARDIMIPCHNDANLLQQYYCSYGVEMAASKSGTGGGVCSLHRWPWSEDRRPVVDHPHAFYIAGSMSGFTDQADVGCNTKKRGLGRWGGVFLLYLSGVASSAILLAWPQVCC